MPHRSGPDIGSSQSVRRHSDGRAARPSVRGLGPALIKKPNDQGKERQGPEMLEKLSDKTGGLNFRVRNDAQAKEAVNKAGQALRNEYLMGYQPLDSGTAGKWHRVRVKSNVPKVDVHACNGYCSP